MINYTIGTIADEKVKIIEKAKALIEMQYPKIGH